MPGANEYQRPVIFTQATDAVTELVQQVLQIFEGDGDVCFTDSILKAKTSTSFSALAILFV